MKRILRMAVLLVLLSHWAIAQNRTITGTITDASGAAIAGVNVTIKGTSTGTLSDAAGKYSLVAPSTGSILVFSFVGFATQEIAVTESSEINVRLEESVSQLDEVVVTVGRGSQRTIIDNPVPVDVLSNKELQSTGQLTFDKALQYRVPSFNVVNTPVNDATTLIDPYEIRNLGPSRTLILINGKRKNLSSLLYVQFSPGRGETGADISAIPTDAIKRVEILRDGASAQYGSDAIAGVMNVILKDRYEFTTLNINSGVTGKGDGATYGVSLNSGANFAKNGFLNYTVAFNQANNAVRSGIIDVPTEIATFGGNPEADKNITDFLKINPTGGNINGTGETTAAKFEMNLGLPLGERGMFYANAAVVAKKVLSNANYRTPYWRTDFGLLHTVDPNGINYTGDHTLDANGVELYKGYMGYMPTFEGDMKDYNATLGVKNESNGWVYDASFTAGGNSQLYTVNNTVNRTLGNISPSLSPTSYKPGGYQYTHLVGNIDISKQLNKLIFLSMGAEARTETYKIIAGDTASYSGEGANSFPGIRAENARTNSRFNVGGYVDASFDITENFLVEAAARAENYSDFGSAFVWKGSTRYKLADDKIVLRASASTGFRAPTLHQIYAQSTQASFAGNTIVLSGLFNNYSKEAFALGIPKLKAEKSTNYTVGVGLNPTSNLSVTLDYYDITIKDRVVYSSSITSSDPTSTLGQILAAGNLASVQFFINGIKTQTRGLDFVISYRNLALGAGTLGINLAGNYNISNKILGAPNDPKAIADAGATILNTQVKSLLTEGRPKYKVILGFDYAIKKFNIVFNNTLFGPTKFQDLDNGGSAMENIKQEFKPGIVSDINIGYSFTKNFSASLMVNNVFNVLPKWELKALNQEGQAVLDNPTDRNLLEGFLAFSGRYRILGYNGSQFSQLGTIFQAQLTFRF